MIKSFKHKGLANFFETGSVAGIQPKHAPKLSRLLDRLEAADDAEDMNFPGSGFHKLIGKLVGYFAVKVSGNWRLTFKFDSHHAEDVDYTDYH